MPGKRRQQAIPLDKITPPQIQAFGNALKAKLPIVKMTFKRYCGC